MKVFSRHQLYEMVWDRPVSKVGPEIGLSSTGLKKQCAKHGIPVPDARYWGLLHAGKNPAKAAMPPLQEGLADKVVIHGRTDRPPSETVKAAIVQARLAKVVDVPERLHGTVANTISLARKTKQDDYGALKVETPTTFIRGY